jgi:hypothetical protein
VTAQKNGEKKDSSAVTEEQYLSINTNVHPPYFTLDITFKGKTESTGK